MMSDLTVADELAYDALPDDTRALCDKIFAHRIDQEVEARVTYGLGEFQISRDEGFEEGKAEGIRVGYQRGYDAAVAERKKAEGDAAAS
jgi:flagellar biosynthesis/type III secretory pathway protein FliH